MKTKTSKKITLSEQTSSVWRLLTFSSFILCLAFIALYWLYDIPFWGGVFRLLAFAGFAVGVIGFLHMRGNAKKIVLQIKDGSLLVNYFLSGNKSQEEFFDLPTIKKISIKAAPNAFGIIPQQDVNMLQINFTDSENKLSLLRFEGHDVYISPAHAQKAQHFLQDQLISAHSD